MTRVAGFDGRFDAAGWLLIGRVLRLRRSLPHQPPSLIDLGMGRGRDLNYLTRCGFRVFGIDSDPVALAKARLRAVRMGLRIPTRRADLAVYRIPRTFDVVFSSTALNCLEPRVRPLRFSHFRAATHPGGIHAVNVLVDFSPRTRPNDVPAELLPFRPGELARYYRDWDLLESDSFRRDCPFGSEPHGHDWEYVVARNPAQGRARRG